MTENQIYINDLFERARRDGLVKTKRAFAKELGVSNSYLCQITSGTTDTQAFHVYHSARNWEKAHYPIKSLVGAGSAAFGTPEWEFYRRSVAKEITGRLISQPAAWSCDKRELVKEAVEVSDMLIKELGVTKTASPISAEDVGNIFDKVRKEQTKYSATEGCYQEVADWFNKSK